MSSATKAAPSLGKGSPATGSSAPARGPASQRPPARGPLATRSGMALLLANTRYWTSVAPVARAQLARWRAHALAIEDPGLRALAVHKLEQEGFNAEVAATLATLAPRAHRERVVEAIVALEVLYDYLDGLTERPHQPPGSGERLYQAFIDAVSAHAADHDGIRRTALGAHDHADGYLRKLAATVREVLATLPASGALAQFMQASAKRAAEAQLHIHGAAHADSRQLEAWARLRASGTPLHWREYLAGAASSVLATHALIAAAADARTTAAQGMQIDRIYLSIAVLPTILDSLVDYESDTAAGRSPYVSYYESPNVLAERIAGVIGDVVRQARSVPNGAHHVMTLAGVVAYYASAPSAKRGFPCAVTSGIKRELRPLIGPTLAIMRTWRTVKRVRVGCSRLTRAGGGARA